MHGEAEGVKRIGSFITMTKMIASTSSTQSQQFFLPKFLHGHGAPTSPSQQSMSKNVLSRKMSPSLKVGKLSDSILCREGGHSWLQTRNSQIARNKCKATSTASGVETEERRKDGELKEGDVQTVVIVGAGLSGLATALALHRYVHRFIYTHITILCVRERWNQKRGRLKRLIPYLMVWPPAPCICNAQ